MFPLVILKVRRYKSAFPNRVCTLEEQAETDICNGPVQPLGFFYFYSPQIGFYY